MSSIDNYYLLLALMHGVYATLLLVTIIVVMMVRLGRNLSKLRPSPDLHASLLSYLAASASRATCAMASSTSEAAPLTAIPPSVRPSTLMGRPP